MEENQLMADTNAADDEGKEKVLNDNSSAEEPRSKVNADPSTSDAKLWDLPADFDVYCINKFESVTIGKEAGWPGQWEEVVEEEMTEEQLLYSLQVKGSALSDEAWQQHWGKIGPGLLAHGWLEKYPSVPLSHVEQITGVTFLSQAAIQSSELADAVESLSLNDSSGTSKDAESKEENTEKVEEKNKNLTLPDLSGLSINETTTGRDVDPNSSEQTTADVSVTDNGTQPLESQQSFSNEEITEMWLSFYNEFYWYCYQQFAGMGDRASEESGVNLIEDFVQAKSSYELVDGLVAADSSHLTPTDDKVNSDVSLAPETVEQNPCTSNINSEPADRSPIAKDDQVDASSTQNTTQSCPDTQEECKKIISDSQECDNQTEKLDVKNHLADNPQEEPDSKYKYPDTKDPHRDEKPSDSKQLDDEKDNQPPPADGDKKVNRKPQAKHIWQLTRSIQYTSIVWALQEAGIISSDDPASKVVDDQTPCHDQLHCNGNTPDKETGNGEEDKTNDNSPKVAENTTTTKSSSVTSDSLKRKR